MSEDYRIYVDGEQSATLNDGGGALTDYRTLQEAVLAWRGLRPEQKVTGDGQGDWRSGLFRLRD